MVDGFINGQRYEVEDLHGVGGLAVVHAARDATGTPVVVKLPKRGVKGAVPVLINDVGVRKALRDRYGDLAAHRIVGIVDAGTLRCAGPMDGLDAMVMPLYGPSLRQILTEVALHDVLRYLRRPAGILWALRDLLRAACALHAAGIIHGDFKAANVLTEVRYDNGLPVEVRLFVTDFGCAVSRDGPAGTVIGGTPAYMAPERRFGAHRHGGGEKADVYGIFALLMEILSGLPERQRAGIPPGPGTDNVLLPAELATLGLVCTTVAPPSAADETLFLGETSALTQLILRGLAVDPRHRPSAAEALAELTGIMAVTGDLPGAAPADTAPAVMVPAAPFPDAVPAAETPRNAPAPGAPSPRLRLRVGALQARTLRALAVAVVIGGAGGGLAVARDILTPQLALQAEDLRVWSGRPQDVPEPLCRDTDGTPLVPAGSHLVVNARVPSRFVRGLHTALVTATPTGGFVFLPDAGDPACAAAGAAQGNACMSFVVNKAAPSTLVLVAAARMDGPIRRQRLMRGLAGAGGDPSAVARLVAEEADAQAVITLRSGPPGAACPS